MDGFRGPPGMFPMGPPGMMGPPMGPGMMPGMMHPGMDFPFPQGMEGPGMEGPAWKRQRMDLERGPGDGPGASRQDSVFYKTRMCHKWQEGRCTFGDRCNYAHGEAELRPLPPEGYEILERLDQRRSRKDGDDGKDGGRLRSPGRTTPRGGPDGFGIDNVPGPGPVQSGAHLPMYKTKLCQPFMMSGECSRGDQCSFAHGPQELRSGGPPPGPPMGGFPPETAMMMGMPGMMGPPGMMMPPGMMGGPMVRPGMMPGVMPPGPRPPPGAPPPAVPPSGPPPRSSSSTHTPSPASRFDTPVQAPSTPPRAPDVPAVERARAMCMLLGLSNAREKDVSAGALAAARACIRTGEVYLQSAYADGIDSYVQTK
ncbi:probable mRNA decay activator protein ZFP36L1 at N-terminal half [Coccomyxa sp. Obi]|nr:probable mRNA decay activator protein ZFP36L1 at N-terminal half [Coccomyxa sp. Obi]